MIATNSNTQNWYNSMSSLCVTLAHLEGYNVLDIEFENGEFREVYVASTPQEKSDGLSKIVAIDLDGMLFCYDSSSYVPFSVESMMMDISIGWYTKNGDLIKMGDYMAGSKGPIFCHTPFNYVLEAPLGTLPNANIKIRNE